MSELTIDGDATPPYAPPEPPRRRPGSVVAIGIVVAAALVAAVFAVVSLAASEGSGSPEAAVERLFDAVEQEDLLGVLEALAPGERAALRPGLEDVAGELRRLGVLADDLDLGALRGVDFEIDGVTLETEPLTDDRVAVHVTGGTISTTTTPRDIPVGPVLQSFLADPAAGLELEPSTSTEELSTDGQPIVVVDDDGWHVSLFYSIAESGRREAGLPLPDPAAAVRPQGAESPEAVVRVVAQAAAGGDLRRLIAVLAPDEMAALQDYAPLFLDQADDALVDLRAHAVNVDRLDTEVDIDGDTASVRVTHLTLSGQGPDLGRFSFDYDGRCLRYDSELQGGDEVCVDELTGGFATGFVPDLTPALTTVQRDGQWYLSPTRTVFDLVVAGLQSLERKDLEDVGSLFSMFFGMAMTGQALGSVEMGESPTTVTEGPGSIGAVDPAEAQACFAPFDELDPASASESDFAAASAAVEACMAELGANAGAGG